MRIKALRRAIEAIEALQTRRVRSLGMDDDPDEVMSRQISDRLRQLKDGVPRDRTKGAQSEGRIFQVTGELLDHVTFHLDHGSAAGL